MLKAALRTAGARVVHTLLAGAVVLAAPGCARQVDGAAVLPYGEPPGPQAVAAVNADAILLDLPRMRGITGGGSDLNIIPSMDSKTPVDVTALAEVVPAACRFVVAETATFGPGIIGFHKITYQHPPVGGLISQGAAVYHSGGTAHAALYALRGLASECAQTSFGQRRVGNVTGDADSLLLHAANGCGRLYHVKSAVLAEVTYCAFPDSVPDLVMTNMLGNVPG
jgi:hypothetical protein